MSKVKFIPNHKKKTCWVCKGHWLKRLICKKCGGAKVLIEKNFTLIGTTKAGQKIAFSVDGLK